MFRKPYVEIDFTISQNPKSIYTHQYKCIKTTAMDFAKYSNRISKRKFLRDIYNTIKLY